VLRANRLQRLARPSGSLSIRPLMSPTGNQRKGDTQLIFVGHDWLEDDHDVAVMNEAAGLIRSARLSEGVAGVAVLHPWSAD